MKQLLGFLPIYQVRFFTNLRGRWAMWNVIIMRWEFNKDPERDYSPR